MEEDLHELLRQEDEEASFADKYAEELEMMDGMETDFVQPSSQPVSSSRKSLGYYGEGAKESLDESPLPPLPSSNNNSLSSSAQRFAQSPSGEGITRPQGETPQRKTHCIPKTMNNIRTSQMDHRVHEGRHVSTIASLVENHVENDISHCEGKSTDVYSETLSQASKPQKHALTGDEQEITDTNADLVIPRPAKRRRKLIVSDKSDNTAPKQQQEVESVVEQEEGHTVMEEVATPTSSQQIDEDGGNIVEGLAKSNDQFLTSTPNDLPGSSIVDDSGTFITPLTHHHYKRRRVLRREPVGAHVTVTSSDGRRVYLRVTEESVLQDKINKRKKKYQLLSVPFYQLRHEVEAKKRKKLLDESNEVISSLRRSASKDGHRSKSSDVVVTGDTAPAKRQLWVDQYSPQHFTELLSDDGTNRTLLAWLKLWDGVVHGKAVVRETSKKKEEDPKKPAKKQWIEYKDPETLSTIDALDPTNRPKLKLALLCGPPGLGKTTLAHVIARHAGYNVVEMNASDDRSPEVFLRSIEAATQMKAVLAPDSRPNCLIIDEIDGAPTAAINVLLDVIKTKTGVPGKKAKKRPQMLSRPIICICNDQYATSLRQLRQNSLVLTFPPTNHSRLATRLIEICRREHLQTSISAMMTLCEKTDADIRSCLNTLQFIQQNYKELSVATISNTTIGQKDAQRSLFSLWKQVFHLPSSKKKKFNQMPLRQSDGPPGRDQYSVEPIVTTAETTQNLSTNAVRFHNILSAAQTTGDNEKATQGLFENYLDIKFKDPNLEAISLAQDWLEFKDILQRHVNVNQDYSVAMYHHFLCVAYHFLFAAPSNPKIRYPHKDYEARQALQKNDHLVGAVLADVPPRVKCYLNARMAVTELLPPLLEIIAPNLRPVNTQLYSSKEKSQLSDLVDTMIACNLTYKQEKAPDGQYVYVLEPNVDEVVRFSGQAQRKQLTYATKQLIGREIEMEKVRRAEASVYKSDKEVTPSKKKSSVVKRPTRVEPKPLPAKHTEIAPARDFFGRIIKQKSTNESGHQPKKTGHVLWFKFNEGYSNAVRRTIKMKDLL